MKQEDLDMAEKLRQVSGLDDWLADKAYDLGEISSSHLTANPESYDNGARNALLWLRHIVIGNS